jgi:hypothetical protein
VSSSVPHVRSIITGRADLSHPGATPEAIGAVSDNNQNKTTAERTPEKKGIGFIFRMIEALHQKKKNVSTAVVS